MIPVEAVTTILCQLKTTPSESLESDRIEFKAFADEKALHNSKELAEELCALANTTGGAVIIGVRDSSSVKHGDWTSQLVGFPDVDVHTLRERLSGKLKPSVQLEIAEVPFEGKNYVVIATAKKRDSLVSTASGKVCIREGRSSRPMAPDEIERAVKRLQTYDWSSEDTDEDSAAALDAAAVTEAREEFQRTRGLDDLSDAAFLEAIGATKNGVLNKAGLLFLGDERIIRDKLGDFEFRFTWRTQSGTLLINDIWHGCLWNAITRTRMHFTKCNRIHGLERPNRTYAVPAMDPIAFHEAYLNALVHRDYAVDGMVSVKYEGGQLTIASPGGFYGGVTAENIVRHEPRHRNKALARILMLFHLVDRAGVGVLRMGIHSLRYGRSFPTFVERNGYVEVEMEAEFFRPGVFVITEDEPDRFGIADLLVLNSVYGSGYASVGKLLKLLSKVADEPWTAVQHSVDTVAALQLTGTKDGIYVTVRPEWHTVLDVTKPFRTREASDKHVRLFTYLMRHGDASNTDITSLLGYAHAPQTSRFLREAKYVKRAGIGPNIRWSLGDLPD